MEEQIKKYKFQCGLEASQEELSLEDDYKILDLLKSVNLDSLENLSYITVLKILRENNLLEKFLALIFRIEDQEQIKLFGKLKNSELEQVTDDFFILNPTAKRGFEFIKNKAATFLTRLLSSDSKLNALSTTQDS